MIQYRDISASEGMSSLRQEYLFTKRNSRFRRRRNGLPSMGGPADYHLRLESDWLYGMEYVRAMDRDDIAIGCLIDTAVINTISPEGFTVDPNTGDESLDQDLIDRWTEETSDADAFDVAGEMTFQDAEYHVFRSMLVDGDILGLLLGSGQVQLVEAHRCRTPNQNQKNTALGVTLSSVRKPEAYWITRDEIEPTRSLSSSTKLDSIPARDENGHRQVVHVYNKHRFTLTRGVTALHRVIDTAGMFEDLNFAKLVQAQVVSAYGIIRTKTADFSDGDKAPLGEETVETRGDGSQRRVAAIEPGMEYEARMGEEIKAFSPSVPNPEYFPHAKLLMTLMGVNLGVPLVMYLMDASETNFSGYRGAVNQARQGFKRNQQAMIRRFHRPIYEWKIRRWMDDDMALRRAAARSDIKIFRHIWNIPGWPYIQPVEDNQADLLQLRNGLSSPRRIQANRGREHMQVVRETIQDNSRAILAAKEAAKTVNAGLDDEDKVHWRELLFMPTPDGVTITLPTTSTANDVAGSAGGNNARGKE